MRNYSGLTQCDHSQCPARATIGYMKGSLELYFCEHHAHGLQKLMKKLGWQQFKLVTK